MSLLDVQNRAQSSPDQPSSSTISITVLSVTPMRPQKLLPPRSKSTSAACGSAFTEFARCTASEAAAIELPKDRDGDGLWRTAITLPEEIYTPIARAVLDELLERGLTVRPAEDDRQLLRAGLRGPNVKRGCMGLHLLEKRATSNPRGISFKEKGERNCLAIGSVKAEQIYRPSASSGE